MAVQLLQVPYGGGKWWPRCPRRAWPSPAAPPCAPTRLARPHRACKRVHGRPVNRNPFTLLYSVYMGSWSITFLSAWNRRESELMFLWGTEDLLVDDTPRADFDGVGTPWARPRRVLCSCPTSLSHVSA